MLVFLRGFLLLFLLYHILVTTIGYGFLGGNHPQIPALLRDGLRIIFVAGYFFASLKDFSSYWKRWKHLRGIFLGLLGISVFFSYIQDKTFYDMFIGFKYGFYYIFLFLSATFLGHLLAKHDSKRHLLEQDSKIVGYLRFFIWTLVTVVTFGYLWQGAKLLFPNLFFGLGYGPLNDFSFGISPPIYYLTGFEGTLRWQGIFSGPNNYGYFLVAFLPLILNYFTFSFSSLKRFFSDKNNLISLGVYILRFGAIALTLSRSALLGTLFVLFVLHRHRWKRHWKISIGIVFVAIVGILGLSMLKESSTLAHISAKFSSIRYVLDKPLGYGLGSSGPAIHHNGSILPENYFIQLLIDIGIIGFAFISRWYLIFWKNIKTFFSETVFGKYLYALTLGWGTLLIMGFFLHVFEDSMVNYSFFIIFGLLCGYTTLSKNNS